ncbi:TIGR01906 family membrane protein [[Clostridium] aminophilum]|uniref:TIGR01906 family membrane protein n=1 Tax=[Clostridium] aminophilum TaxID=1526 RepID=UPI003329AFE4
MTESPKDTDHMTDDIRTGKDDRHARDIHDKQIIPKEEKRKDFSYGEGILSAVFALALLFTVLITSFEAVCYWTPGLYDREFRKYNVPFLLEYWKGDRMDYDGINTVIDETMLYLRGERENLIVEVPVNGKLQGFYREDEISHMTDVREVFLAAMRMRSAAILLLILTAGYLIRKKGREALAILGCGYLRTCLVILGTAAAFGALCASDFTKYFTVFHEIFFSQGNWEFDPHVSRMICIMPEEFFSDIALRILITFLCSAGVLGIPAIIIKKNGKGCK